MGLIGDSHNEVQKQKPKVMSGEVCCNIPTATLTKGKRYRIRGHFCFLNKMNLGDGDFCWVWDEFITIKNDDGYTVKVNTSRFTLQELIDKKNREKLEYESNPLNILQEAHQLIPQRYE
jgi:hypothetical protein